MSTSLPVARVRPAGLASRLVTLVAAGILMFAVGCETAAEEPIEAFDASSIIPQNDAAPTGYDASSVAPAYDAGITPVAEASVPSYDAGAPVSDASASTDAGPSTSDAATTSDASTSDASSAKDASAEAGSDGGGFVFPDLFPKNDAGPAPTSDAGTGGRNPNGPCKDLNLLCFDFIDMYFNAECFTCNGGKGCQGCAIPFAY